MLNEIAAQVAALPLIALTMGVVLILLLDLFKLVKSESILTFIAAASLLLAWGACVPQFFLNDPAFSGSLRVDGLGCIFETIILVGTFFSVLLNHGTQREQNVRPSADIIALILLSSIGGMVMVISANLIVFFLAFELLSVCVYVLSGLARGEKASAEAALKYFLLGAFSSCFLLYGMVLIYAATGSMELTAIGKFLAVSQSINPVIVTGIALALFGFAFKLSLVPFHFWAPDVYQGAPVSVVTFMAVVVKAAAFGSLLRFLGVGFGDLASIWSGLISVLCAASMMIGNLAALRQKSMKRMLAYSSIAHAGYMLLGVLAARNGGFEATIFYVIVYSVMTVSSFGVVLLVSAGTNRQYGQDSYEVFKGLGWKRPFEGICMSIAILSLAGFPPLAGFFGKLYLFSAAVKSGYVLLTVFAALNSLVSLGYYLRVLVTMYFIEPEEQIYKSGETGLAPKFAVCIATLATLVLGIYSSSSYDFSTAAVRSLELSASPVRAMLARPE